MSESDAGDSGAEAEVAAPKSGCTPGVFLGILLLIGGLVWLSVSLVVPLFVKAQLIDGVRRGDEHAFWTILHRDDQELKEALAELPWKPTAANAEVILRNGKTVPGLLDSLLDRIAPGVAREDPEAIEIAVLAIEQLDPPKPDASVTDALLQTMKEFKPEDGGPLRRKLRDMLVPLIRKGHPKAVQCAIESKDLVLEAAIGESSWTPAPGDLSGLMRSKRPVLLKSIATRVKAALLAGRMEYISEIAWIDNPDLNAILLEVPWQPSSSDAGRMLSNNSRVQHEALLKIGWTPDFSLDDDQAEHLAALGERARETLLASLQDFPKSSYYRRRVPTVEAIERIDGDADAVIERILRAPDKHRRIMLPMILELAVRVGRREALTMLRPLLDDSSDGGFGINDYDARLCDIALGPFATLAWPSVKLPVPCDVFRFSVGRMRRAPAETRADWDACIAKAKAWWRDCERGAKLPPAGLLVIEVKGITLDKRGHMGVSVRWTLPKGSEPGSGFATSGASDGRLRVIAGPHTPGLWTISVEDREGKRTVERPVTVPNDKATTLVVDFDRAPTSTPADPK